MVQYAHLRFGSFIQKTFACKNRVIGHSTVMLPDGMVLVLIETKNSVRRTTYCVSINSCVAFSLELGVSSPMLTSGFYKNTVTVPTHSMDLGLSGVHTNHQLWFLPQRVHLRLLVPVQIWFEQLQVVLKVHFG